MRCQLFTSCFIKLDHNLQHLVITVTMTMEVILTQAAVFPQIYFSVLCVSSGGRRLMMLCSSSNRCYDICDGRCLLTATPSARLRGCCAALLGVSGTRKQPSSAHSSSHKACRAAEPATSHFSSTVRVPDAPCGSSHYVGGRTAGDSRTHPGVPAAL